MADIPMSHSITITVLYFAAANSATGLASESITLPSTPQASDQTAGYRLADLGGFLVSRHEKRGGELEKVLAMSRWSVDADMVDDADTVILRGGEEVAVIPPVSGG